MFWILRRTGASNLFNSINSNYSSKPTTVIQTSDKKNPRPPRKSYGRLSVEADDAYYHHCKSSRCHQHQKQETANGPLVDILGGNNNTDHHNNNNHPSSCQISCNVAEGKNKNNSGSQLKANHLATINASPLTKDDHFTDNSMKANQNQDSDSDGDWDPDLVDHLNKNFVRNRKCTVSMVRIQAMAISDDDDYDESLTCNVCDRAFNCHKQLSSHQQKKRHFGCSGCDSLFPSLMLLEHHKEEFEHWSDVEEDNNRRTTCCNRRLRLDEFTDTDDGTSDAESEDLERLL